MGAKEGAMILDLIPRLKEGGDVSVVMILQQLRPRLPAIESGLIQDGVVSLDKPTLEALPPRSSPGDRR